MAQYAVFRKTAFHGFAETENIINAFSNKGTFAEYILINIGYGPCVRIYSGLTAEDLKITGRGRLLHAYSHSGLKYCIAFGYPFFLLIIERPVKGMRERAGKFMRGVEGKM